MARGYYRKQRYIIRTKDSRGMGASSVAQVKKLASQYEIDYIETETGDMTLEQFLDLETQAAVARYAAEPPEGDEERGEPQQAGRGGGGV